MKNEAMKTLTVSLSPRQVGRLHEAVESGLYASNSEVVREALRLWEHKQELRAYEMQRLKEAYDVGKASGQGRSLDADTLLAELKADARTGE